MSNGQRLIDLAVFEEPKLMRRDVNFKKGFKTTRSYLSYQLIDQIAKRNRAKVSKGGWVVFFRNEGDKSRIDRG